MNIAIVGFATEGRVSAQYWASLGHTITVCDRNAEIEVPAEYATQLGESYVQDLDRFDVIVRSAGIHPGLLLADNPTVKPKVTSAINEFLRACPTKHVIGITGTKGKGTTSTLTTKMLEAAGKKVWLGGNIGRSPLEFIDDITPADWVVLELSSFQLIDLHHSPHIATCLMVVPEHLNWHADMDEYVEAKSHLFECQTSDDVAIYFCDNALSCSISLAGAGKKVPYFRSPGAWVNGNMVTIDGAEVCTTDELKLLGKHNWQNVCAAITTVWQAGLRDIDVMRSVVTTFAGLPHRLEKVRVLDGVTYYNDSFASGPDAAIAAIEAIPGNKVLIMGGFDRGLPLGHVPIAYIEHSDEIRTVLLIGASAERLKSECEKAGFHNYELVSDSTIIPIIQKAKHVAQTGDSVIFSPGFASFDMFKNFEDRGTQYREAVQNL